MTAETMAFLVAAASVAATAPSNDSRRPRPWAAVGVAGTFAIAASVSWGWLMTVAALLMVAAALQGAPRTLGASGARAGRGAGRCMLCTCAAAGGLGMSAAAHVIWFAAGAVLGGLAARALRGRARPVGGLVSTAVQLAIAVQLLIVAAEASA